MKKVFFGLAAMMLLSVFASCDLLKGDADEFAASVNETISNDAATLGLVGTTATSSDTDIATAEIASGKIKITSVSEGSAVITVFDDTHSATINITVTEDGTITIDGIEKYEGAEFAASVNETIANDVATLGLVGTTAASSDTDIATAEIASGKIKITSVSEGSAVITVSDGTHSATINITVTEDGTITIDGIVKYVEVDDNSKKLVIKNIGVSGDVLVLLAKAWGPDPSNMVAVGTATGVVKGSDVTITLRAIINNDFSEDNWQGNDSCYIWLTNTLTPSQTQQPEYAAKIDDGSESGAKFDFSNQVTEVDWSLFAGPFSPYAGIWENLEYKVRMDLSTNWDFLFRKEDNIGWQNIAKGHLNIDDDNNVTFTVIEVWNDLSQWSTAPDDLEHAKGFFGGLLVLTGTVNGPGSGSVMDFTSSVPDAAILTKQ